MTTNKKRAAWGGGITLAGIVLLATQWQTIWTGVEPTMSWLVKHGGSVLAREQVQAVLASTFGGLAAGAWLPHVLPGRWSPTRTRSTAYALAALLTLATAWGLVPTREGFVYALLAALASPTLGMVASQVLYLIRPCAKPESLQP